MIDHISGAIGAGAMFVMVGAMILGFLRGFFGKL